MSRFPAGVRFQSTQAHSSNFTNSTWDKSFIVLHWWDNPAKRPQFDGVVSWFRNPSANVSCQYVVEHNRIAQMTPESAYAWHAGSTQGNRHGIGIEVNPRLSAGDYETTAVLVAEIWRRRGRKLPLRRHREFTSTNCPGTLDVARVQRRAEQLYSGTSTPSSSQPAPAPSTPATGGTTMSWNTRLKSYISGKNITAGVMLRRAQQRSTQAWQLLTSNEWKDGLGRRILNIPNGVTGASHAAHIRRGDNTTRSITSRVSGAEISLNTAAANAQKNALDARNEAREVKAIVKAQAEVLDQLLKGQGAITKAVEEADQRVIRANAADVAAELEVSVKDKEED